VKTFKYAIIAGWALFLFPIALAFLLPRVASHILHHFASSLPLIAMALLLLTAIYRIGTFYRTGMNRPVDPPSSPPPK
jgi:hypothetical protein